MAATEICRGRLVGVPAPAAALIPEPLKVTLAPIRFVPVTFAVVVAPGRNALGVIDIAVGDEDE